MARLRLSVIGAGSWVNASHLPVLAGRGDIEFLGVCRRGETELERMKSTWDFRVASEDYEAVLDVGPDIVIVASPAAFHFEHARAALLAGAHVLVEKPFTISVRDAWTLVELARTVGREIVVSLGYNFRPMITGAMNVITDYGGVGEIESVAVSMSSGTRTLLGNQGAYPKASGDFPPDPGTWIDPALSGGGYGQAQLPHALGAALYLTGLRGHSVYAAIAPHDSTIELDTAMTVRYLGGAIGSVTGTSAHKGYLGERDHIDLRIVGDEGHLDVQFERNLITLYREGQAIERLLPPDAGTYDCVGPPNALADLALGRDVLNRAPGELGARTVEIISASYSSAETGQPSIIDTSIGPKL
jgi:predicted dehydrogenase